MKRRLGTRIAAMLMAVVMLITQLPLTAIAEDLQASRNESAQNQAQSDDSQDLTGTEKANSAYGAVNQITGMELTASGTTGDCTWTLYGTELFIDGQGKMQDYSSGSTLPWGTSITKVHFGPGVTHIGKFTFQDCTSLAQLVIPDNVTSIGAYAFSDCKKLAFVQLSNGITAIESHTFYGCLALTQIIIPEGVTCIDTLAFGKCFKLENVTIPNSLVEISYNAFSECSKLEYTIYDNGCYLGNNSNPHLYLYKATSQSIQTLQVHNETRIIGSSAFNDCDNLISVTLGEQVTHIRNRAFLSCAQLTEVFTNSNLSWIDANAFAYCSNLTNISIPDSITYIAGNAFYECPLLNCYQDSNGTYLGNESNPHIVLVNAKSSASFEFYEDTKIILDGAFQDCAKLTNLVIPDHILAIGQGVFAGCASLTSITTPFVGQRKQIDTAESLRADKTGNILASWFGTDQPSDAYTVYYSVTYTYGGVTYGPYYIPKTLVSITVTGGEIFQAAFYGCASVQTIHLPQSITEIQAQAFESCNSLTGITIPSSVTVIGENAFKNCYKFTEVVIPDTVLHIQEGAFVGCKALQSITIPFVGESRDPDRAAALQLFKYIFASEIPSTLTTVTVTGGVIPAQAFKSCTTLTTVILSEGVTAIGQEAFLSCSKLRNITLPNSLEDIGESAFSGVTPTYHSDGVGKYLGNSENPYLALADTVSTTITSFEFREETNFILDKSFYGCSSLTSIEIPEHITRIGAQTFYGCKKLASIRIPQNIKSIGSSAFTNCSGLTRVDAPDLAAWCEIDFSNAQANPVYYSKMLYIDGALLTDLVVPSTVSYIGDYAFYNCIDLTSVTMQEGVTRIGDHAFDNCTAMHNIVIPDGMKEIGEYAFQKCTALMELVIPNSVESIGLYALAKCSGLKAITIPFVGASRQAPSQTPRYPFGYLFGISSYTGGTATKQTYYSYPTGTATKESTYYIPTSLTSVTVTDGDIPYGAFQNCKNITAITLPETATVLGGNAFYNCIGLQEITIPQSVTTIGDYAFYSCKGLTDITIGSQVTSIGNSAFYQCIALSDLTLPNGLEVIGASAFYGCTALQSIAVPSSVTTIGASAFQSCTGITEVTLSSGLTEMGASAFKGCTSLQNVIVPSGAAVIGSKAFQNCTALTEIILPGSVQTIDSYAFDACSALEKVIISNGATVVGDYAFQNCALLTEVVLPGTIQRIGNYAFSGCTALNRAVLSNGVASIGTYAFQNCTSLPSIDIPDSVQGIGIGAFSGCAALESMTIPFVGESSTMLNSTAQYPFGYIFGTTSYTGSIGCKQTYQMVGSSTTAEATYYIPRTLASVTVTGGEIVYGAFQNCSLLKEINLPAEMKTLGSYAFYGCSNLKSIHIPKSVTTIGGYAFYRCSALEEIIIPDGVVSIGAQAFRECTSLTEIVLPNSVETIGSGVFGCCSKLESITVPFIGKTRNPDGYQYPLGYFFMNAVCQNHRYSGTSQTYYASGTSTTESVTYYIPPSLTKVTVTDGDLYYGAFYNCKNLTSIALGEGVLNINANAFYGCSNLEQFEVDQDNPNYCSVNRILYNKAQTTVIHSPAKHAFWLQVSYTYVNGDTAFAPTLQKLKAGDPYTIEIPELAGYSARIDQTSGTMPAADVVIDVIYYENDRLIYGACTDSIEWTLYDDGVLTLRGVGDMPNYESGSAPWAPHADQILMVYIDARITSIGAYAFEGCRNMTFVDYGYSVKTIGAYAFADCSALASLKLPDSVSIISKGAFSGCTGLKSVVIPDHIVAIEDYAFYGCSELIQVTVGGAVSEIGNNAFANCGKLTQVYFRGEPVSLGSNAFGGVSGKYIYYYSSINGWDEVITDGLWCGYTAVPYNAIVHNEYDKDQFDGTNIYIIKVVDKHGTPLVNAVVKLGDAMGHTNSDGMAYFVKPQTAQHLEVSCSNHIPFEDAAFSATTSQIMDIIELSDKPITVQGVACDGKSIATSVVVLNCAEAKTVAIAVRGNSPKYTIIKYELYQGDRLIATEKTSVSNYTFHVTASVFEEGETVLVRMYTADGNMVATALNIDVVKLATIDKSQILAELNDVNLGASLGSFGDIHFTVPFSNFSIDSISVKTEGRSIFVGLNLDVNDLGTNKVSRKAIQKKIDNFIEWDNLDGNAKSEVEIKICGYLEIEYLGNGEYYIKSSYVKMSVGLMLESELHASFYGIVGVYFKLRFGPRGQLELKLARFDPEKGFQWDQCDITLESMVDLEGGAFLLWGLGSAGAFGNLTMGFTVGFIPTTEIKQVYVTGDLGIRWKVAWGLLSGEESIGPKDIYRWPEPSEALMLHLYTAKQNPDSYSENDRSYLADRSPWLSGTQEDGTLQKNIYDSVAPEIVVCGDTAVMVWLDDNSQRDNANFQMLYYSVYSNGAWSEPMAVCDNGTFDCEFDVYTDGEKIYVIYTEMKEKLPAAQTLDITDMSSIELLVTGVEVNVSVYEDGKFGDPVRLTDNSVCEQLPTITEANGVIAATWLESNSLGIGAETAGGTIIRSVLDSEGWSNLATLANGQNLVSDMTAGSLQGIAFTAYIVDADGDGSTTNDKVLALCFENGDCVQLDTGAVANITFTNIAGTYVLAWYNNGTIYLITAVDQKPIALVPAHISAGIDYQIVSVSEEQTLLFFTMKNYDQSNNAIDGTDIYGMYINCNGALSSPVRMTKTKGYVTSYCVYAQNEELFAVFTETFANVSEAGLETVTHFRSATLELCWDVVIENVEYDLTKAQPSSEFHIGFSVANNGTNAVDCLTVNFYDHLGNLLYTTYSDVKLESGASIYYDATVVLPQSISAEGYVVEILPQSNMLIVKDSDPANNRVALMLAYTDMSICAEQKIIGEKNYIIFSVANEGNTASTAKLKVYAEDRLVSEMETSMIHPGSTEQYLIDIHALTSEADKMLSCIVTSDFTDPFTLNDTDSVYLLHIEDETLTVDPEEAIRNPEISVNVAEFDKFSAQDITIEITAEAESFASIEGLTLGEEYTAAEGIVTISSTYLATLSKGSHTLNFVFDFGNDSRTVRSLTVVVIDTTPIVVSGSISISGEVIVGNTVYADISKLSPKTANVQYIWSVNGETVSTDHYYQITSHDTGKILQLTVIAAEGFTGTFTAGAIVTLQKPEAPSAPVISKVDSNSIAVVRVIGLEYSLDGIVWQRSNVFEDLLPNETYTVYARKQATETSAASDSSAGVTVTTSKTTVAVPAAPAAQSIGFNTIILVSNAAMEYKAEGGEWTENPTFSNLQPNTSYVFYQRYKETDSVYASEASVATFTTKALVAMTGATVIDYTIDGSVVTVHNAQACKMGYWDAAAETYVEIPCTASADGSYCFRAPDMAHEMLLVVIGDINLDGKLDILDKNGLADAITKDTQTLTAIAKFAVDVNGNGKINSVDLILIARSILPESHAAYKPFVWKVHIPT